MALILAESFEQYAGDEDAMLAGVWANKTTLAGLSTTDGARTGSWYFNTDGSAGSGQNRLTFNGSSLTSFGIAYGVRFPALPAASQRSGIVFLDGNNVDVLSVVIRTDGFIEIRSGSPNGTLLTTSTTPLDAGAWYHMEIQVVISETVGSCNIRLNGVAVAAVTGQDFGTDPITQVDFDGGDTTVDQHLDDIVVYDFTGSIAADWLGPVRVQTIYLEADEGTPAEWSVNGGGGDGVAAVDEAPPDDDTSYIQAANPTDQHRMSLPALPSEVQNIYGIYTMVYAKQDAAGATSFKVTMISDGNSEDGDTHSITTAYAYWQDAFTLDPDGDVQWTKAQLEAALIQLERVV